MILKAQRVDLAYEASLLAVVITEKDIFRDAKSSADLRERIEVLHEVAQYREPPKYSIDLKQCRILLTQAKRIEKKQKAELNSQMLGLVRPRRHSTSKV
jgi:ATP-dependent helicase HrpB